MKRIPGLLTVATTMMLGASAYAHHSFAPLYDSKQTVTIEGRLVSFSFRSPHSVVIVETQDASGEAHRWTVEWGAASQLGTQGITREFFKPGDEVIVAGFPGRKQEAYIMVMRSLERPSDGFKWGDAPGETVD